MKKTDPEMIDEENPEWTDEMFAQAKPAREALPPAFLKAVQEGRVGRPSQNKKLVSLRLSEKVLGKLREGGKGWQTRANAILEEHFGLT